MGKVGKPPTYDKNFHPADFIAQCKEGKIKEQIASSWDVDPCNISRWAKKHKEFCHAIRLGKTHAKSFWFNMAFLAMIGKATLNGQKINIDFRYFNWIMMNCFGVGKEKKPQIINVEFKKLIDIAKQLEHMPQGELIKVVEQELARVKK